MTSKSKHCFRLERVLSSFHDAVFLTLTTADVVSLAELRARWRKFRHDYLRHVGKVAYVCVFEVHPMGHGFHIHVVFDRGFLPVQVIRKYAHFAGFGRIHIERAFDLVRASQYLVKYLSKSIKHCRDIGVSRVRLINLSRGLLTLAECESCGNVITPVRELIRDRDKFHNFFANVPLWLLFRHVVNFILFGKYYYCGCDYDRLVAFLRL